jgi:hypothetical protein
MASYFYANYSDGSRKSFYCDDAKAAHKEASKDAIGRYIKTIMDESEVDTFFDIGRGGWVDPAELRRKAAGTIEVDKVLEAAKYGIGNIGSYRADAEGQRLQIIPILGNDGSYTLGIRERRGKKEVFRTFNVEIKVSEILPSVHKWVNATCENCNADLFDVDDPSGECKQ